MQADEIKIEALCTDQLSSLLPMMLKLWPDSLLEEERDHIQTILSSSDQSFFMAKVGESFAGFIQVALRHDYVEGTRTSPVAYIEGLYVEPAFRKRQVAHLLVKRAERWGEALGCREMASDCDLDNEDSISFHLAVGFQEVNRVVCFSKSIGAP